jgi:hypothetical protein
MVAQKEQEGLRQTFPDHAARRFAIQVDSSLASAIVMAKLQRSGAAK